MCAEWAAAGASRSSSDLFHSSKPQTSKEANPACVLEQSQTNRNKNPFPLESHSTVRVKWGLHMAWG